MQYTRRLFALLTAAFLAGGCADISPGRLADVTPVSDSNERVGNAYLFRGFIGIFSTGMNDLGDQLNEGGVRARVFQADQWSAVADAITEKYKDRSRDEPVVLVGHSYGADNVLRIAQKLKENDVKVDLLITLDPVTPPKVPANVVKVVNLYQSNGVWDSMPWLRGIPLEEETPGQVALLNEDIRVHRTDLLTNDLNHFNIEKQPKIHDEVIRQIKAVCIPRGEWAAMKAPRPAIVAVPPTTQPREMSAQHAMAE